MGKFPRGRENTKIVGKLEKLVEDRGEFRGTVECSSNSIGL